MRNLFFLAFLMFGINADAQYNVLVKDGNGQLIGVPVSMRADRTDIHVMTERGSVAAVNSVSGALAYGSQYSYFSGPDCTGSEYSTYEHISAFPRYIVLNDGSVALLPRVPKMEERQVQSYELDACYNLPETQTRMVVDYSAYRVDPTEHGMTQLPGTANWGYAPPVNAEIQMSDGIFCSSFEGCAAN